MFDIGWSELLVIGVVALLVIGPKELPAALRLFGQWMGKVRRMASEFQGQFQEAMREAEMADIKKQVDDMTTAARDFTNYDPMSEVRNEIDGLTRDPLGANTPPALPEGSPGASADKPPVAAASPEAAAPSTPAPVSPDFSVPQPSPSDPKPDLEIAAEAPQPKPSSSSGSGG